jgi:glucose-6-phosphate isomerase
LRQLGPDWQEAHIAIVSKSGGTLETLAWAEKLGAQDPTWLNPTNCTLIASPGHGALQTWAEKNRVHTLTIPENIGGRFSVLTACGMFPAGLMGLSLFEFRQGAAWALENVDLASHLSASILTSWKREEWITQLWTYSENLRMFGQWWQQLWGESLAKRVKRDGSPAPRASTPMSCMGSRDHHSLLQQLIDGYRDKHVLITRVKSTEAGGEVFTPNIFSEAPFYQKPTTLGRILGSQAEAFERSLIEREIGFDALELESLTEKGLGAFFMLWQMVIAQLGEYLEINAFDQPGVESGKRHAEKILRR